MVLQEFSLRGKKAIVTGDEGDLVKFATLALAEAGADVALTSRDPNLVDTTTDAVRETGQILISLPARTTELEQVQRMVDEALSRFGNIDVLVNIAPLKFAKPILEVTLPEWRTVMDENVTSTFLCCRAVGRHMVERRKGRIINIISGLALTSMVNSTAYCASMGAIRQFTSALAVEWARMGVRVNAIALGWFSTELHGIEMGAKERLLRYIPLKRYGHPSELAGLLVYLASDISDFVTGHTITLDGGINVHP